MTSALLPLLFALAAPQVHVERLPFGEAMCSRDGWCVQLPVAVDVSRLAAHDDTLVVASSSGVLALWHDGAWQPRGVDTELSRIDALGVEPGAAGGLVIAACAQARCVRGTFDGGVFILAPADRDSVRTLVAAKPRRRVAPPADTPLQCSHGVEMVGRPDAPFVACRTARATSLFRSERGRLSALAPAHLTANEDGAAVPFEGGGCAPCFFGEHGLLWSNGQGWSWLARDAMSPKLGRDEEGHFIGRFGVDRDQPILRNGGGTSRFDGRAWTVTQASISMELGANVRLQASTVPAWGKVAGKRPPVACRETKTPLVHAFVRGDEVVLHGPGLRSVERLPTSLDGCTILETSSGLLLTDGRGGVLLRKAWESVAGSFAIDADGAQQFLAVRSGSPAELLEVRAAPHMRAPRVAALGAAESCVTVVGSARRIGATTFRPVITGRGERGWVSDRVLSAGAPGACP